MGEQKYVSIRREWRLDNLTQNRQNQAQLHNHALAEDELCNGLSQAYFMFCQQIYNFFE
jgi:hypothetical protein